MNNNNSSSSSREHAWSSFFWRQFERNKADENYTPVTEQEKNLARLLDAWKAIEQQGEENDPLAIPVDGSLEHECTGDCSWKHIDAELSVCLESNNYHICTTALCGYRTSDSSDGHESCTLTGRVREEVQYAVPTYGTRDGGGAEQVTFEATSAQRPGDTSTQKADFASRERSFIEGVAFNTTRTFMPNLGQQLAQQTADLCVMIYYQTNKSNSSAATDDTKKGKEISEEEDEKEEEEDKTGNVFFHANVDADIYSKDKQPGQQQQKPKRKRKRKGVRRLPSSLQIEKYCTVLLNDMACEGITVHVPNKQTKQVEPLTVLPASSAVRQHWPGTSRVGELWDIEVSKDVHASLTLMGATRLRALASIIREKRYTLFAEDLPPPPVKEDGSRHRQ